MHQKEEVSYALGQNYGGVIDRNEKPFENKYSGSACIGSHEKQA